METEDLRRLQFTQEDLEERLRALHRYAQVGACVNGIAHDLNNMLGIVLAYAELIEYNDKSDATSRRMAKDIVKSALRASELVTAITIIARRKSQGKGVVALPDIVRRVVLISNYNLQLDGIDTTIDAPEDFPACPGDEMDLQLALLHLVMNAHEAVGDGPSRTIGITLRKTGAYAEVHVSHNGQSLSPEQWELAMEPYVTSRDVRHLGLGLPSCRELVERHGGAIAIGEDGRTCILRLPLRT